MKKHLFFGALAACVMSLSSCDGDFLGGFSSILDDGILGEADLVFNGDGYYADGDTIHFQSSIADCFTAEIDDSTMRIGTLDICANVDLSNSSLEFPFMAFQVSDSVAGVYHLDNILTEERLSNFNFDSIAAILREPSGLNLFVVCVSDTSWYVSCAGDINISEYPSVGHNLQGTFSDVQALYVTQSAIERLNENMEAEILAGTFSLDNYAQQVNVSGSFTSRRYSIIHRLVEEAFSEGGMVK